MQWRVLSHSPLHVLVVLSLPSIREGGPHAINACRAESRSDSARHQSFPGPWALGPKP